MSGEVEQNDVPPMGWGPKLLVVMTFFTALATMLLSAFRVI